MKCKECGNRAPVHSLSCSLRFEPLTEQPKFDYSPVSVGVQAFDSSDGGGCWGSGSGSVSSADSYNSGSCE